MSPAPGLRPNGWRGTGRQVGAGRRAVLVTLGVATVTGVAAGAVANQVWTLPVHGTAAPAASTLPGASRMTASGMTSPTGRTEAESTGAAEPATLASPPTATRPPSTSAVSPTALATAPALTTAALLTVDDWRRVGLRRVAAASQSRTVSRCQGGDLGRGPGVLTTLFTRVAGPATHGTQAVVETRTAAAADELVRSVVAWRDTCNPTSTLHADLGTSALTSVPVAGTAQALRWTFVYDATYAAGSTTIEQVVVVRTDRRVSVAVVSVEVPQGSARTIDGVDMTALARATTARLT